MIISIANYLGFHDSTIRRWRKKGILSIERRDGKVVCSKYQLEMLRRQFRAWLAAVKRNVKKTGVDSQ